MKNQYKLAAAAFMGLALASCADDAIYEVDAPDWMAQRIDSIANEKNKNQGEGPELVGMKEDYYTIGKTDFTSGWWADFSKDYVIADGEVWNAVFTLNINPNAPNTYKNFALVVTNDAHRGDGDYKEYGACRYDHQPSGNSEWGDAYFQQHRGEVTSTLTFETDTDAGVDKLGGKVILTIDRSQPDAFIINITNGVVTKTMHIKEALPNLNEDGANTNIRAFLVVEGSYIQFEETNIVPVGGLTSREDKQPLTLNVQGIPDEVLFGTEYNDLIAKVKASVEFEEGVSKDLTLEDLQIMVVPDFETLGHKTLVFVYNKTFKGDNCATPVLAVMEFDLVAELSVEFYENLVFPTPGTIGLEDNSTPWWQHFTDNMKVNPGETAIVEFTNYSSCLENYHNFCVILNHEDATQEYGVVRADNWGWGNFWADCQHTNSWGDDWETWRMAMDGAKCTVAITNNADGTADIRCTMIGNNGVTYQQDYLGLNTIDKNDLYFRFVCEGSHLVFNDASSLIDNVTPTPGAIGLEDNTTPWWQHFTENVKVAPQHTAVIKFTNYSSCLENYHNFCVILNHEDATQEYGVVRADNWGWGNFWADCQRTNSWGDDWETWRMAMNGAQCTVAITNNADGTADIRCTMIGNNGVTYQQDYLGLNTIDKNDLYFRFVCEGSHLVFE